MVSDLDLNIYNELDCTAIVFMISSKFKTKTLITVHKNVILMGILEKISVVLYCGWTMVTILPHIYILNVW